MASPATAAAMAITRSPSESEGSGSSSSGVTISQEQCAKLPRFYQAAALKPRPDVVVSQSLEACLPGLAGWLAGW